MLSLGLLSLLAGCGGSGSDGGNGPPPPPPAPVAATVTVTPGHDTVIVNGTLQLSVTVKDSNGVTLTGRTVTWTSSNGLATVSAAGLVTAHGLGSVSIQATADGKSGSAVLLVTPVVRIAEHLPSLFAGDTTLLTATVVDAQGSPYNGAPATTWTSRTGAVASVLPSGVVQGQSPGLTTVVASTGGATDSLVVAVLAPGLALNREIGFLRQVKRSSDNADILEVWAIDPDGMNLRRVSEMDQDVVQFVWSPDGSRLAVVYENLNGVGKQGLWVMNADGAGQVQAALDAVAPRWSPDGQRLAFRNSGPHIVVVNRDGGGLLPLTSGSGELDPDWSPDGRQIAFRRQTVFCDELWVMDATGANQHKLLLPLGMCEVRWSPDGKDLAFLSPAYPMPQQSGIWIVHSNGTGVLPLSPNCQPNGTCAGASQSGLAWSPDGARLAFATNATIQLVNRDGTGYTSFMVTSVCCISTVPDPTWSPDGTLLVFQAVPDTGAQVSSLGVTDPAGSSIQFITSGYTAIGPVWRP